MRSPYKVETLMRKDNINSIIAHFVIRFLTSIIRTIKIEFQIKNVVH